jgi:hypothetical protein
MAKVASILKKGRSDQTARIIANGDQTFVQKQEIHMCSLETISASRSRSGLGHHEQLKPDLDRLATALVAKAIAEGHNLIARQNPLSGDDAGEWVIAISQDGAETLPWGLLYPVHAKTRNSFGSMTRKLSVTVSQ